MREGLISVIIPAYNASRFVSEAIESIFRQNYENMEVIVVNDGSTDNTLEVLDKFDDKINVISKENGGVSSARNMGIRAANGSIIGFLDSDDIWPDDHISLLIPHLGEDNKYDYIRGFLRKVSDLGTDIEKRGDNLDEGSYVGAYLYRRSVFDRVGIFDESMYAGEDGDFFNRLLESECDGKMIAEVTLLYRRHENNMTNSPSCVKEILFNIAKGKILRGKTKLSIK